MLDRRSSSIQDNAAAIALEEKAQEINLLLSQPEIDLWKLREYALSEGGLVNDSIRQRAWPALVGLQPPENSSPTTANTTPINNSSNNSNKTVPLSSSLPQNQQSQQQKQYQAVDVRQIEFDVTRCTWHLLTGNQRIQRIQMEHKRHKKVARIIRKKQHRLASLIHSTLVNSCSSSNDKEGDENENDHQMQNNEEPLYYYQGYHDVACIFLSALAGGQNRLQQTTWTTSSTSTANNSNNLTVVMVRRDSFDSQSSTSTHNSHVSAASRHSNNSCDSATKKTNSTTFQFNTNLPMSPVLQLPSAVLLQISKSHFYDCMQSTFLQLQTTIRLVVFPMIALLDSELHDHLLACEMEPFFVLPWIITWFAHEIRDTSLVKRIFDAFIVSHPLLPIYVAIAMICHKINRSQVLDTECDFSTIHHALLELPKNSSMVGWKYQPGDGYISDEEGDDQGQADGCASIVSNSSTMDDNSSGLDVDGDVLLFQAGLLDTDIKKNRRPGNSGGAALSSLADGGGGCSSGMGGGGNDVVSLSSMSSFMGGASSSNATLVPFQELIDTSVNTYMRQIPPRRLLALSKSYYGKEQVEALLQAAEGESSTGSKGSSVPIKLFDNAPSWAIAPTAQADWLLKQHAREREGSSATNRRDRRRRSASTATTSCNTASAMGTATATLHQRALSSSSLDPISINTITTTTTTTTTPSVVVMAKDAATIAQILNEKKRTMAVIATGYGPSHEEERRLRKRQKVLRLARRVAWVVALSTVIWAGMGLFSMSTFSSTSSSSGMHHHLNKCSSFLLSWTTTTTRTMMVVTTLLAMAIGTNIMGKGNKIISKLWKKCKNQFNL